MATVIIQTGTGPTVAGELAVQWTAQELLAMTDHGYHLANHVNVDGRGDADHVLVGPGGLFVLETKWSATEWTLDDRFFAAALRQVQGRARSTWLQLKPHGVSSATPVLVLWGQAAKPLRTGVVRNGDTYVLAGNHLKGWLLGRPRGVLTPAQTTAAYDAVCVIAASGDKVEAPVPPSIGRLYGRTLLAVTMLTATFTAPLLAARWGFPAYVVAAALFACAGFALRRRDRVAGLAVVTGACASLAVGIVAFAGAAA